MGKHNTHGKQFTLTRDTDGSGRIDTNDIEFSRYPDGDGDFQSHEVCELRDEAEFSAAIVISGKASVL